MFSLVFLMLLFQGHRRQCLDDPQEDVFGPQHYGELGYVRDVCVALGRDLIRTLKLTDDATKPCQELALIRTSTCWPFLKCKKWEWNDKRNKKAFETVSSSALKMVEQFNNNVSEYPVLCRIEDQKFIWKSINTAVRRLIKSGAVAAKSDLIAEIHKLRSNYCRTYKQITMEHFLKIKDNEEEWATLAKYEDFGQSMDYEESEKEESELWGDIDIEYSGYDTEIEDKKHALQIDCKPTEKPKKRRDEEVEFQEIDILDETEEETRLDYKGEQNKKMSEVALHESIFRNDYDRVYEILNGKYDVKKKDKHGNTALHLAVMLGRKSLVELLLSYGAAATIRSRNVLGWCPMDEAISYGDVETGLHTLFAVKLLMFALSEQTQKDLIAKRHAFLEELVTIPDFYMELKWEFTFAVNLLSYFLPADVCKMRKRHKSIRFDWTLVGIGDNKRYKYGHEASLFDGTALPSPLVYYLDVETKEFMLIEIEKKQESNAMENAKSVMNSQIVHGTISTSKVEYSRAKNWRGYDKTETVGPYEADIYNVKGLAVKMKLRTEHLKEKKQQKKAEEKKRKEEKKKGKEREKTDEDEADEEKEKKKEEEKPLPPPPPTDVTWEQYIDAEPGKYRTLARKIVSMEFSTQLKEYSFAMAQDFPITKEAMVRILEVVAPFKQFTKLREFVEMKLPPGFPVKLDVPLMMGVSAKVTVLKFQTSETIANEEILDESLFKVPEDYKPLEKKKDTPKTEEPPKIEN